MSPVQGTASYAQDPSPVLIGSAKDDNALCNLNHSDLAHTVDNLNVTGNRYIAAEAEGVGVLAHGGDAERDVFFERDAEFCGAVADVIARDSFGEGLVLQFLFHRFHFEIKNAF